MIHEALSAKDSPPDGLSDEALRALEATAATLGEAGATTTPGPCPSRIEAPAGGGWWHCGLRAGHAGMHERQPGQTGAPVWEDDLATRALRLIVRAQDGDLSAATCARRMATTRALALQGLGKKPGAAPADIPAAIDAGPIVEGLGKVAARIRSALGGLPEANGQDTVRGDLHAALVGLEMATARLAVPRTSAAPRTGDVVLDEAGALVGIVMEPIEGTVFDGEASAFETHRFAGRGKPPAAAAALYLRGAAERLRMGAARCLREGATVTRVILNEARQMVEDAEMSFGAALAHARPPAPTVSNVDAWLAVGKARMAAAAGAGVLADAFIDGGDANEVIGHGVAVLLGVERILGTAFEHQTKAERAEHDAQRAR